MIDKHSHGAKRPAGWTRERWFTWLFNIDTKCSQDKKERSNSKLYSENHPFSYATMHIFIQVYIIMHNRSAFLYQACRAEILESTTQDGVCCAKVRFGANFALQRQEIPTYNARWFRRWCTRQRMKSVDTLLESMQEDITEIVAAVLTIKELDKDNAVPISLKHHIRDAFKCKICLRVPCHPHRSLANVVRLFLVAKLA